MPDSRGDDVLVDDWHTDSYPFVAIVMMTDPTGVLGGETAVKQGDGSILPIGFPTAGSCVVLQASHLSLFIPTALRSCAEASAALCSRPAACIVTT